VVTSPVTLILPESVEVEYGDTTEVTITVQGFDPLRPITLVAESSFRYVADVANASGTISIGSDGKATLRVAGVMPGEVDIIIAIPEKGIIYVLPVQVTLPDVIIDPYAGIIFGDVNGDGVVDARDAVHLLLIIAELLPPITDERQLIAAKLVSAPGVPPSVRDATEILLIIAGLRPARPVR
jgi:hypothetical protein